MRKLWRVFAGVLSFVVLGAVVCFGQAAGFIHGEAVVSFDDPWPDAVEIDFEVGAEYSVSDWSFGVLVDIEQFGLEDLAFLATGSLGALNVYSLYWLDALSGDTPIPGVDLSADWENALWMDVGGVELWAFFSILAEDWQGAHQSGAGLALGGHGSSGPVELWAEFSFNLEPVLSLIYFNDFERVIEKNLACDFIHVYDPTCELDFTHALIFLEFPFCCAEVGSFIGFDFDGFSSLGFWTRDLPVADTGLSFDWIELYFDVEMKDLDLCFAFDIGEVVCIEPFITLETDGFAEIEGLEVVGLELVCELGDVTVTISELFSDHDYYLGIDGAIHYDGPTFGPIILSDCVDPVYDIQEAIAIEVRREGCCGGDSFFGVYNFFDVDLDDVMFDWAGLRARAVAPVTPALSMYIETWIWYDGIESIALGFDATWGTLKSVTSDWTCCLSAP